MGTIAVLHVHMDTLVLTVIVSFKFLSNIVKIFYELKDNMWMKLILSKENYDYLFIVSPAVFGKHRQKRPQ